MTKAMYVHVPFCNHICAYCDFMRCGYLASLADRWLSAIKQEVKQKALSACETIYIGGGTPSALSTKQLEQLLIILQPYAKHVKEYTIEVNADSLTLDKIEVLSKYGINRISMGAQTFQKELLEQIERVATYELIKDRIYALHTAGITNISLDLMYGLPNQTMAQWIEDLEAAQVLPISHTSLYALTIEEHSKFGREHIKPCDDELEADFYECAMRILKEHEFEHYEISSFARNKQYAMHNLAYWHYDDFYGIGCGASGKEHHIRYDQTRNLNTYITQGPSPLVTSLSKEDEMFETMMMGLRIKEGISKQCFFERFDRELTDVFHEPIQKHLHLHNIKETDTHIKTTKQGMMILHDILVDFL